MKVISLCHMFPNPARPTLGIFVKERLVHVGSKIDLTMVAPVPSFPGIGLTGKYAGYQTIPFREDGPLTVFHPRYFMIPKYLKRLDASFYRVSLDRFLKEIFRERDAALLDVHWVYPDGLAALRWARANGKKVVVTVRGNEALHYYQDGPVRRMIARDLRLFDHVISVSHDLKEKMVREYSVPEEKITVIHNGVDRSKFAPLAREEARLKCGLEPNGRYILGISRLSGEKGLEYLLQAVGRLRNLDVKLLLIGDGPLRGELENFVRGNGLSQRVTFLKSVPHADLGLWYNAADLFCLSSIWEGCPNVVLESLSCGTPVVSSRVGAVPHFVDPARGAVVPPADPEALAEALDSSLERPWDRISVSECPALRGWERVADEVIEVFAKVLAPSGGPLGDAHRRL